ncbi:MAG: metallophosphoesterase family protein [Rhodomicrobiaceae bacterium]
MASLAVNTHAVPLGMRVYAIGDIHGRLDLLDQLLEMITADAAAAEPGGRAILIFLGDYIDRGPDSRGVIERLLTGLPDAFEPIFLRGNHEEMLLRTLESSRNFELWAINGGLATARSYGIDIGNRISAYEIDPSEVTRQLKKAMPESHYEFLRQLPIAVELGDYLFVHAGVRPGLALDAQAFDDCLFIRDEFLDYRGDFGKIIVHGHTPMRAPDLQSNRIGIDTGAFFTGRLTALCLEGTSRRFLITAGRREH